MPQSILPSHSSRSHGCSHQPHASKVIIIVLILASGFIMCGGAIISNFIPRDHSRRLSSSDPWPGSFEEAQQSEDDMEIRKSPLIFEEDKWILPLVKRTRTTFECRCSKPKWTQVEPESSSYKFEVQEESGWSPNAKSLPGRTYTEKENNWHNLEMRLAGKRKICDINVNLDNNLESPWPLFSETSDEEDIHGSSDSDTYSGPS